MSSPFDPEVLASGATELNVTLSAAQVTQMIKYCELLSITNQHINLTRVPPADYVTLHLLDSLSIRRVLDPATFQSVVDVGTGAGFPGIPLAIAFPQLEVLMVDATRKKLTFIDESADKLGLKNVKILHSRIEELGHNSHFRDRCPLVTARALAPLPALSELLLPLVALGGNAVCYKGPGIDPEIDAAKSKINSLGGAVSKREDFILPKTDAQRTLIVLEKRTKTPERYPAERVK